MTKKKLDACSIKHIQKELEDNGLMTDPKMEDASTVSKLKALAALMSAVDHRVQGLPQTFQGRYQPIVRNDKRNNS